MIGHPNQKAWWRSENNYNDNSGNGNNGTGYSTSFATGILGQCVYLNGSAYVDCGNNASLQINSSQLTIAIWVKYQAKPTSAEGIATLLSKYNTSSPNEGFAVEQYLSGGTQYIYAPCFFQRPFDPTLNTWYHLILSSNGTNKRFFVNGAKQYDGTAFPNSTNTVTNLTLGKRTDGWYFTGWLDDLIILNTGTLTDMDCKRIYTNFHPLGR